MHCREKEVVAVAAFRKRSKERKEKEEKQEKINYLPKIIK
jgi:hypothetical protein